MSACTQCHGAQHQCSICGRYLLSMAINSSINYCSGFDLPASSVDASVVLDVDRVRPVAPLRRKEGSVPQKRKRSSERQLCERKNEDEPAASVSVSQPAAIESFSQPAIAEPSSMAALDGYMIPVDTLFFFAMWLEQIHERCVGSCMSPEECDNIAIVVQVWKNIAVDGKPM